MAGKTVIEPSELIINPDGSVFHLHMKPGEVADRVILVGDPGRVGMIAEMFDRIECRNSNREFVSVTGYYRGRRFTALSTGIGADNIDIVATELDALVNVDFSDRTVRDEKRRLNIVRLGTCGALQPDLEIGDYILSGTSCGFDGLLGFYGGRDEVCDQDAERAFVDFTGWKPFLPRPYFVNSSRKLCSLLEDFTREGITVTAPGFYGPQGRRVRLPLALPDLNSKIESFTHNGRRILNFEMESSALAGLSALLGHEATTVCTVIAQRVDRKANTDYRPYVKRMIEMTMERLLEV